MSSTPINELIAAIVVARIQVITLDNGWVFDVSEVVRPNRKGDNWEYKHMGVGVVQSDDVVNEELSHAGNPPAEAHDLTLNLYCITRDSKDETDAHATATNLLVASVRKAITSPATWHTFGGYAIDAEFGTVSPFVSPEGELLGATLPLVVTYRISENDPFIARA